MILPLRRSRIPPTTWRVASIADISDTSRTKRQVAGSDCQNSLAFSRALWPTLLNSTSIRLNVAAMRSNAARISVSDVQSSTIGSARQPSASISRATAASGSCSRSSTATSAPARARQRALARPMPFAAPVTTQTLFASSGMSRCSLRTFALSSPHMGNAIIAAGSGGKLMARVAWRIIRNLPLLCCLLTITGAGDPPQPGKVLDEARQAGRSAASLPAPVEDYFHDMDGGADLKTDPATKLNPVTRPQHLAGLDRRQRPVLGQDDRLHLRRIRPVEDHRL